MRSPRRSAVAVLVLALAVVAGCDRATPDPAPEPVRLAWQEATLPAPEGGAGRLAVRDATVCAGTWYVVGAVVAPDGGTRPAAWTSVDGVTWRSLTFTPRSFYGRRNVVYAAGCRDGRLAAIGAQVGGAHGYPRVNTWYQRPDGSLDEVEEPFETYGGPTAVNVARIAGGPAGWLIAGNRSTGAAAWVSPDSAGFRLLEGVPELRTDDRGPTWAADGTATGNGWMLVGGVIAPGRIDRDPVAWISPDGLTWQRTPVPADGTAYDELQRVSTDAGQRPDALAVGLRGARFGAWRYAEGRWALLGTFGATGGASGSVRSLVRLAGTAYAVTTDGTAYGLWTLPDPDAGWLPVALPAATPAGADRAAAVTGAGGRLVLLADDARAGRVWSVQVPSR